MSRIILSATSKAILSGMILVGVAACDNASQDDTSAHPKGPTGSQETVDRILAENKQMLESAPRAISENRPEPLLRFQATGGASALTFIVAEGEIKAIAGAFGEAGMKAYDLDGSVVLEHPASARIASFYLGRLVILRNHENDLQLERFTIDMDGWGMTSESTDTPSPVSGSTLLRSNYSSLGPARMNGEELFMFGTLLPFDRMVTAMSSVRAKYNGNGGHYLAISYEDGEIVLFDADQIGQWATGKDISG